MSIRIQFAKAALQGLLANPETSSFYPELMARTAYNYADAMVEEHARRRGEDMARWREQAATDVPDGYRLFARFQRSEVTEDV